jgi:hypothetical protein
MPGSLQVGDRLYGTEYGDVFSKNSVKVLRMGVSREGLRPQS